MTREEAIKWLNRIKDKYIHGGDDDFDAKRKQALDMAIEALSSEAVQGVGRYENAIQKLRELPRYINGVKVRRIEKMPTKADTVEVVRCKDCCHANECHKSVHYTRNESNSVVLGYLPIEWCSRGERKGGDDE